MSVASKGYRYSRCGPIASVLKLDNFSVNPNASDAHVVVKMLHAPIHRTDASVINGTCLGRQSVGQASAVPSCIIDQFPRTGGFEGVGVVVDAARSARVKSGDLVWISPSSGVGTWATHIAVSGDHVHKLPQSVTKDRLPLAACSTALITGNRMIQDFSRPAKDEVVIISGASSLTALAAANVAKRNGAIVIAASTPGQRFDSAKTRFADLAADVVEYTSSGAKNASRIAGERRVALFLNGTGGKYFNDFARIVGRNGTTVTYGAQNGFGLMWAAGNQILSGANHVGFFAPRYLSRLDYAQRQKVLEEALDGQSSLKYPVEAVTSLEALGEGAWDKAYLAGGKKYVFAF
jgi:NADPH:quinone reductase-like Zn-dependent oxidoreductase